MEEIKERANEAESELADYRHDIASRRREFLKNMYLSEDEGADPELFNRMKEWLNNASDEAILEFYEEGAEGDAHYKFYKLIKGMSDENKNRAVREKLKFMERIERIED